MSLTSDYRIVASALRYLDENLNRQPGLEEVAGSVGLSPYHFQRLFTRWAGVSPKRFLQFLTLESLKARLRDSESILHAAFATGLSGPARVHDLFVTVEGVTPGEYKALGAGVAIRWGLHPTPFGPGLLAVTARGLVHLSFLSNDSAEGRDSALTHLANTWPRADLQEDPRETEALARQIFSPGDRPPPLRPLSLFLKGTSFQIKVWSGLLRIPPGTLTTYGRLAEVLGQQGASRAVGNAVGANPIAYLIPCHRVIRETGAFGGYRWGSLRKRTILGWEAAQDSRGARPSIDRG